VNGDGFDDVIVGAPSSSANGTYSGASYVVFGKASGFDASVDLGSLDGTTGFRLVGTDYDNVGQSVASAGDLNGDGFDDLIVGMLGAHDTGEVGEVAIVFGKASGFAASIDLWTLDGTTGFRLAGRRHSMAGKGRLLRRRRERRRLRRPAGRCLLGDFNGAQSGSTYVVFGGFGATIDLGSLDGTTGFRIDGEAAGDLSGRSVASAGDVNGDGFDDIIVGALEADPNGNRSGASYVVFGKEGGFGATIDLASLDGTTGFRLSGAAALDRSGVSVASAGDVNGDGFDDVIIGAHYVFGVGIASGASYVVFGKAGGFASDVDLSSLDGTTGFGSTVPLRWTGSAARWHRPAT
jgi:hypothetical protein